MLCKILEKEKTKENSEKAKKLFKITKNGCNRDYKQFLKEE